MKLFHNKDKKKNQAIAISVIDGTDGPIAVFKRKTSNSQRTQKELEHEKLLQQAAETVVANSRDFLEIVQYLKEKYQAVEHILLPQEIEILKANVIMNHFSDVLEKPQPLSDKPTKKEILSYYQQDTTFIQARQYDAESLGLDMRAYKLTNQQGNKGCCPKKNENAVSSCSFTENDIIVELEMKSEYLCIINGTDEMRNDLTLWYGVSQQDIDNRTPRFLAYAYAMKQMGRL